MRRNPKSVWTRLSHCRLRLRLALLTFIAIATVSGAVLVGSVNWYHTERLKEAEREALVLTRAILRADEGLGSFVETGTLLRRNSALVGLDLYTAEGRFIDGFGERPFIVPSAMRPDSETRWLRSAEGQYLDVVWPTRRVGNDLIASARVDVSGIAAQVEDRMRLLAGYAILASVLATFLVMLVMEVLVLRPFRAIGRGLRIAAHDPLNSGATTLGAIGPDELRGVAHDFDVLMARHREFAQEADTHSGIAEGTKVIPVPSAQRLATPRRLADIAS